MLSIDVINYKENCIKEIVANPSSINILKSKR